MSTELNRLSELATADKTTRFLSLAHLLTPAALMAAFEGLRKDASAGVDEVTYREYEQNVWQNIPALHHRLVSHQYRVQPLRRVYIPKENGKERPISIPALEDKIRSQTRPRRSTPNSGATTSTTDDGRISAVFGGSTGSSSSSGASG